MFKLLWNFIVDYPIVVLEAIIGIMIPVFFLFSSRKARKWSFEHPNRPIPEELKKITPFWEIYICVLIFLLLVLIRCLILTHGNIFT